MDEARRLLDAGEAEQSAALLERDLLHFAGSADYDYLLGLALYRAGHHGRALFAFDRVVMVEPNNLDARLKAAQINAERGGARFAEDLLAPLSKQRLGAEQLREVERIRAEIAAAAGVEGFSMRGYVLGGIGWDGNVTSGPDRQGLVIPFLNPRGLSTTPLGKSAQDSDTVGMAEVGLALRQKLFDDTWLTGGGSIRQGFNSSRKDMKEGIVNVDLGVLKRHGSDFWGASLLSQEYLVGDKIYRKSLGPRLSWIHPLDNHSRLSSYLQYVKFDYPDNYIDNAARKIAGISRESTLDGGAKLLQYGIYGGQEDSKDNIRPHFSYRLWGVHVGGNILLRDDLSLGVAALYEWRHHVAEDKLYLFYRRDEQLSVGVSADYQFSDRWHLIPQYTYTLNASNAELYQYTRNTVMLQLRWDFDNGK